jgi:hypothetical protein
MRKVVIALFILSLTACTAKEPWTKDAMVNKCLGDFNKRNEIEKKFTTLQIGLLCDCVAGKVTTKYKTAKEADKDEEGVGKIGADCAMEVMSK